MLVERDGTIFVEDDGAKLGTSLGASLGLTLGLAVGEIDGRGVGTPRVCEVGEGKGRMLGAAEGSFERKGFWVGRLLGDTTGELDGFIAETPDGAFGVEEGGLIVVTGAALVGSSLSVGGTCGIAVDMLGKLVGVGAIEGSLFSITGAAVTGSFLAVGGRLRNTVGTCSITVGIYCPITAGARSITAGACSITVGAFSINLLTKVGALLGGAALG